MFRFRACPRCQGDLYTDRNEFDEDEIFCVQCGLRRFSSPELLIEIEQGAVKNEPVTAQVA